jgi:hypothetical protein
MSSLHPKLQISFVLIFFLICKICHAKVYVYEVVTDSTRFQTVSKLNKKAFLFYNGGKDIIKKLTILKVYADNNYKKALKDYKLEESNSKMLLPQKTPATSFRSWPFVWWR